MMNKVVTDVQKVTVNEKNKRSETPVTICHSLTNPLSTCHQLVTGDR